MAKKTPISKKLAQRDYKPASKIISWIYKTIMVDIVGRKYKPMWIALAMYNESNDSWIYYGANSTR